MGADRCGAKKKLPRDARELFFGARVIMTEAIKADIPIYFIFVHNQLAY